MKRKRIGAMLAIVGAVFCLLTLLFNAQLPDNLQFTPAIIGLLIASIGFYMMFKTSTSRDRIYLMVILLLAVLLILIPFFE